MDTESFAVCGGGLVFDQLDEVCPGCATVTFAVQPTEPGTLIVTVRATTSEFDPNLDNNTAAVSSTVVPSAPPAADLQITKIDTPDPVSVGQSVVYTITVRNNGPQAATGVRLIDPLTVTLPLIRVQTSQGTFSTIDQALVFEVGTIASGAEAVIMIEVSPTKAGSVTNAAFVNAAESDPNSANNRASTTTTVNP